MTHAGPHSASEAYRNGRPAPALSRDAMHRGFFAGAMNDLYRLLDGRPQATDFSGRIRVVMEVLHIFAAGQRKRIACPMGDLATPDRDLQPHQTSTRGRDG